jgi:hypothetical protein
MTCSGERCATPEGVGDHRWMILAAVVAAGAAVALALLGKGPRASPPSAVQDA